MRRCEWEVVNEEVWTWRCMGRREWAGVGRVPQLVLRLKGVVVCHLAGEGVDREV